MSSQLQMWTTQYHDETVIAYSAEDAQAVLAEYWVKIIGENEPVPDDYRWQALPMDNTKSVWVEDDSIVGDPILQIKTVTEWLETHGRGHFSSANW